MLVVKKGNKQYKINENQKERYLKAGFDVLDAKGKVKERGELATPKRLQELQAENEKLKAEIAKLKSKKEASK